MKGIYNKRHRSIFTCKGYANTTTSTIVLIRAVPSFTYLGAVLLEGAMYKLTIDRVFECGYCAMQWCVIHANYRICGMQ